MMYYSVISVSEANKPVWENNSPYFSGFELFSKKVGLIESHRDKQVAEVLGNTALKDQKKKELIDLIVFAEHRLKSYSAATGNASLTDSLGFTITKLNHLSVSELPAIANTIVQIATEHADSIATFGLTESWIANLNDAAARFSTEMLKPRAGITQKKIATDMLALLFKEADTILSDRLDYDAEFFRADYPEFYREYEEARRIHDIGHRSLTLKAKVIMEGSSTPLKNVRFTFTRAGSNTIVIEKKTTDKGNFMIKNLPEGEYYIRVHKDGLKEQILTVTIESGEMLSLNIKMEAA
jgi:hypothetical protein